MALKIVDKWFERRRIDDALTLLWEPYVDPLLRCNIWHLRGRNADLLVDSGMGICSLRAAAEDLFENAVTAVATHTHHDHVGSLHEFSERVVHRLEADSMTQGRYYFSLLASDYDTELIAAISGGGYAMPEQELLTAYPYADFDPATVVLQGTRPTRLVEEGDRIDLGDRSFEVLHLPGHSPGSIALWEEKTGWLFSGDVVYDGPLLDQLEDSSSDDYLTSMERLLKLPVDAVFPGHEGILDPGRFRQIVQSYIDQRSR
jgi:glyoxylase-like metal-dependent hydrolase (beta-lactamase superfamily II)